MLTKTQQADIPHTGGMQTLTDYGVRNIVNHKYKSGDWSVGDKALNPWWEWVATCMPMWLAPNAITLVGTGFMISTLAVGEAYRTGYYAWLTYPMLQLYTAACLFAYQTLDAVDGKQARRTQSSSPLGQLFDHGCDALVTNVFVINVLAALGLDPSTGLGFWSYASCLTVFYLAQWEEGTSHVLRTNVHGMGVTEVQGTAMLLHVCAAFVPRDVFSAPVLPVPSFLHPLLQELDLLLPMGAAGALTLAQAAGATAVTLGIVSSIMFVYHVAVTQRAPSALSSLLPTLLLVASALVDQAITAGEARAYGGSKGASGPSAMLLAYAIAQTHMTTQTIVCSMARQPVSPVSEQVSILAYPAVVWLSWYMGHGHPQVRYVQWAYAGLTVALYLQFAMNASYQIKKALGIHVFVLGRVAGSLPGVPVEERQPTAQPTQEGAPAKTQGRGRGQSPASSPASSRKRASSSKAVARSPSRSRK